MKPSTFIERTNALDDEPASPTLDELLSVSISSSPSSQRTRIDGVIVGTLVGLSNDRALVSYPNQPGTAALPALAMIDLYEAHIGCQVVLMFEEGDPLRPLIAGCIKDRNADAVASEIGQVDVDADGQRLTVTASRQLVLRCGHASITLTCDGKILLHGTYVSNRSSGVMRIKGGSVQIN